jgi:hypothetical protein
MTFCALLGTASTLHYSNAVVVAKEETEARDVLKLSFLVNFCFSLLVAIGHFSAIQYSIFNTVATTRSCFRFFRRAEHNLLCLVCKKKEVHVIVKE